MSPRKFLRNLRFLQILTQGNVVHRGRLFYLTATIFSRDPFDQVVKESGSNPDVVGSSPTTSRFFAQFRAGKFRAGKLRAKSELRQFKNCVVHPPGPPPAQPPGYRRPPPRLPTPPSCPPPAAHPLLLPPCCLHIRKKSLNTPR